jgi:phospholipid/cholesterol/gamma-HCH transport system substrate-binding protein
MERNAHYALVGLASTVLFVLMVVFVVWLARLQFTKAYDIYDVDFKGPVRGLSSGGEVFFNGIKVGEVTKLSLDRLNPNRVVARIRISSDSPVRIDSTGSLEPLGVTGVNYIQITAGTLSKPLLKDVTPSDRIPVIRTIPGQFDSLLEGGGTVLARAVEVMDRVNRLMSDENIKQISGTLADVHAVTSELKDQKRLIADLDDTVKSLNATSEKIGKLTTDANGLVDGDLKRTLANLNGAVGEIRETTVEVRGAIGQVAGPAGEFASTGLPQLSRTVVTLQRAAENLDRLVSEVEANPRALVGKGPAKELEVKP